MTLPPIDIGALRPGEHLFARLPFNDVEGPPESLTVELHNRPYLADTRGALQGGGSHVDRRRRRPPRPYEGLGPRSHVNVGCRQEVGPGR